MTAPPPSILIVEDEQIVALDMSETIEDLGYRVAGTASTGEAAVTLTDTLSPDLVLMDIRLDGPLDGISAAERIRHVGGPPVVFVTAFDDERTLSRAKFSEPYGYVLKPFNMRELRIAIEMALYHHRMQGEREALTRELREALQGVTHLKELLSMCAYCRRVVDEAGEWQSIETFLQRRTGTTVSHGVCPDCLASMMPDEHGGDEDE